MGINDNENLSVLDGLGIGYGTDKSSSGHDYLRIYEEQIPMWSEQPVPQGGSFLELGWWDGASMRMWRDWFPESWTVTGLDIEEKDPIDGVNFVQGGQDDPVTIEKVAQLAGPFDVIVDDASHLSPLTISSFTLLWQHLKPGGMYFIEDLHVSYHKDWAGYDPTVPAHRGRTYARSSTMEFLKKVTDSVHFEHAGAGPAKQSYGVDHVAFWPGLALVRKAV